MVWAGWMARGVALALLGCACEPEEPDTCFFGAKDAAPEIALVYRDLDGAVRDLEDGGEVPLIVPPQGGRVVFVGVRARHVDLCALNLFVAVHDPCSASDESPGAVVGREGRRVILEPGPDGFAWPKDPSFNDNYAHVPMCPNFRSSRDIDDEPYLVRVRLSESAGTRSAVGEARVVPVCAPDDDTCRCTCDRDHVLGGECTDAIRSDEGDPEPGGCFPGSEVDAGAAQSDGGGV